MGQRRARLGRISDVDIRLLRVFQAVVESGGLSAAEVELGIGRSTISTHLADIESRLRIRLCDRGRGGFALTDEGTRVYQATLALMKSLDEFRFEVEGLHGNVHGPLKVALVDNLIWDNTAGLVEGFRRFAEVGSRVDLSVFIYSPDEIERRLIDGTIDLAIAPVMHRLASLEYRPIFSEISYLYCSDSHPFFNLDDALIDEEKLLSCSYVRKGYPVSPDFHHTNSRLRHTVSAYHVESIAMLILTGKHIGFLPARFAASWVSEGRMRQIRQKDYRTDVEFGVVTLRNRTPSPAHLAFVECLTRNGT